jgi:hypothetical protein
VALVTTGLTGGCQCGAIRYRLNAKPLGPHICHCRMCQKAFGSYFAPLVGVLNGDFELTRGTLAVFHSSDIAERGFCVACGTPLTFRYSDGKHISVSIGSLDDPEAVVPMDQHGIEGRVSYFARLAGLPDQPTTEASDPDGAERIRVSNHQHPDHDTAYWPSQQ